MSIWDKANIKKLGAGNMCGHKLKQRLAFLLVTFFTGLVNAAEINDVGFNVMPGDMVEIRVSMDTPPPSHKEFTTNNPARIAMDFAGVSSNLQKKTLNVGVGVTRSVTAVEAGGRTRLIVNLVEMTPYSTRIDGNDFVVTIGHATHSASSSSSSYTSSQSQYSPSKKKNSDDIVNVDFRRGEGGEGRVVIDLANTNLGIDLRKEGRTILADFVDARISDELIRKLDVVDFATPAKLISTSRVGNNVRLAIDTLNESPYWKNDFEKLYL